MRATANPPTRRSDPVRKPIVEMNPVSRKTIVLLAAMLLPVAGGAFAQRHSGGKRGQSAVAAPRMEVEHRRDFDTSMSRVEVALNAYSFSKELNNYVKARSEQALTLFDLIDFCVLHDIPALDLTGYFFVGYPEVPSDEYLYAIKRYAHLHGVRISGMGVRNDFANPDPEIRAAGVRHVKEWIEVAEKLGAPVLRIFAGPVPEGYEERWDDAAEWMIDCFRECAAYGSMHGVLIGVQNHGDMLKNAEQTIRVVRRVNSPWFGVVVDTGYFQTEDPYADIEAVMPYAVNFQLKESPFGARSPIRTDLARLMRIVRQSGYKGYLPVETLSVKGRLYDPYTLVPAFVDEVKQAIANEYKEITK